MYKFVELAQRKILRGSTDWQLYKIVTHDLNVCIPAENTIRGLQANSYIMDISTHYDKQEEEFVLVCKKVTWYHPLRLDNERLVQVLYNQVSK